MSQSAPHVVRRGNNFYFRLAVPRKLIAKVGTREVKFSLRTSDPVEAKVRGRLLSSAVDLLFKGIARMEALPSEALQAAIKDYFQKALSQTLELAYDLPTDPMCDLDAEAAFLRKRIALMHGQLKEQLFVPEVRSDALAVLASVTSDATSADTETLRYACNGVLRAKIENARILAAHLSSQHDAIAPRDPMFTGVVMPAPHLSLGEDLKPEPLSHTLSSVANQFIQSKAKHDWAPKTAGDIKRVVALACAVIGGEKPIRKLNVDDVKAVRDALGALPPNYMKYGANKGLSVQDAVKANTSGASLSLKTQDKYFTMFRQLLTWATNEEFIDKVPGSGVKIVGLGKIDLKDGRHPYSDEQLRAIFSSPLYTGYKSESSRSQPGTLLKRDGKFWVPLIALYSGMRTGEIVQLLASDLKQEAGIWYFDVSKGEGKTLKTASSQRRVPIHNILLDIGVLDLISKVQGKGRIFPEIEKGSDGYYSHHFSKWWGRYSAQAGFKSPKTAFHSFRHNFTDALRAAELPEYVSKALVGHADKDVHSQYGKGPKLTQLKEAMDKVSYDLDLMFLMK